MSPSSHRKEENSPLNGFQFIWKQNNYGFWVENEKRVKKGMGLDCC